MSSALDRMSRLLVLVPWLRAHDGVTITQAAEHFGVSPEQMERDLWLLVVCGIPGYGPDELIDIDFWNDGHVHVRDPLTLDSPMRLTGEELSALVIALSAMADLPGATAEVESARQKVMAAAEGMPIIAVQVTGTPPPELQLTIAEAIAEKFSLDVTYASATSGEINIRRIIPQRIESHDGRHILHGYCTQAGGFRSFRLDRMMQVTRGPAIPLPKSQQPAMPKVPQQVVCALHPSAEWIIDVHAVDVLDRLPDGRRTIRISVFDVRWLVGLALGLAGGLEVLEPEDIRQAVVLEAQSALTAYARQTT